MDDDLPLVVMNLHGGVGIGQFDNQRAIAGSHFDDNRHQHQGGNRCRCRGNSNGSPSVRETAAKSGGHRPQGGGLRGNFIGAGL